MSRPGLVGVGRRLALLVGGEATQSGFHFALNLVLIHALPAKDYGVFAILMVIGGLALTYIRSFTAMPAVVWIGGSRTNAAADVYEVTFGSGALVLAASMGAGVTALLHVWLGAGALEGGVFVGLWAMRSHLRLVLIARRRPKLVSVSDVAFTISGGVLLAGVLWAGSPSIATVFGALAVANGVGGAVLLFAAGRPVRISFRGPVRRRFLRYMRPLGWSGLGVTLANLQGQAVALLVAAIAGPAAYAPIAAMLVLFVPLRIAATALANMVQPDLATLFAQGDRDAVWRQCWGWTALAGTVGLVYGAGMLLLLPAIHAPALEGEPVTVLAAFAWIMSMTLMLYVMPRIALEAMAAFRSVAIVTGIGAVIGLAAVRLLLWVAPSAWALAGGALSETVVLGGSWLALMVRLSPPGRTWLAGRVAG